MKLIHFNKQKYRGRQPVAQNGRPMPAFSYYAGDKGRENDSLKNRKRNEHRHQTLSRLRSVPSITAIIIILLSVVFSTTLSQEAVIKFVGEPSPYRTIADYRQGMQAILGSSVWNKSKITINAHQTESQILSTFPELDAVNVALPVIGRRPTVIIHTRIPAILLTTKSNAYIIDISGKVIAESKQLPSSQREKLASVQDQSGFELHVGSQALTAKSVLFILNVQAQLNNKQLKISQLSLPPTPNEVDIHIQELTYYIKADSTGDARIQIGDFLAARDSGAAPSEYMDVRVEEKVFYK